MHFLIASLWACGTQSSDPATDGQAGSDTPDPSAARQVTETPTGPLPFGEVTAKLAKAYGVSAVQCPVGGAGRLQRIHGLPRDFAIKFGPKWLVEVADDIPWGPTYDSVTIEDGWVTVLARPGSTEGFVRSRTSTTRMAWPPAEAGKTVTCTSVQPVPERVVVGTVPPRQAQMFALGCTEEAAQVARDGTFVVDARPPCTLWLETNDAHRTSGVLVPAGGDKLQLDPLEYRPDPLQNADRSWTDKGKEALSNVVTRMEKSLNQETAALDAIESELGPDATAQKSMIRKWRADLQLWRETTQYLKEGLAGKGPL